MTSFYHATVSAFWQKKVQYLVAELLWIDRTWVGSRRPRDASVWCVRRCGVDGRAPRARQRVVRQLHRRDEAALFVSRTPMLLSRVERPALSHASSTQRRATRRRRADPALERELILPPIDASRATLPPALSHGRRGNVRRIYRHAVRPVVAPDAPSATTSRFTTATVRARHARRSKAALVGNYHLREGRSTTCFASESAGPPRQRERERERERARPESWFERAWPRAASCERACVPWLRRV